MATSKGQSASVSGWLWCTLHCLIYSSAVCLFLWRFEWVLFGLIFLSHFPVDKFSLADKWNGLIRGRTKAAAEPDPEKRPFSIAFTCIVYVVVDNTMHLLLMWAALSLP